MFFFFVLETISPTTSATTKNSEDKTRSLYHSLKQEISIIGESKSENGWRGMQRGHAMVNEEGSQRETR